MCFRSTTTTIAMCSFRMIILSTRSSQRVLSLDNEEYEVSVLAVSPDKVHIAVGYSDGSMDIFDKSTQQSVAKFHIHSSAVNVMRYDASGMRIATGGLDTDITLVDVVAQVGQCKLSGHRNVITDLQFLVNYPDIVVSASKDTQIKFWDVNTQSCFKTLADNHSEVWKICILRDRFLISGGKTSALNVYEIAENKGGQTLVDEEIAQFEGDASASPINCKLVGTIERTGHGRTISLATDQTGSILACHGKDDKIELFYFRSQEESLEQLTKRMKKLSASTPTDISENISLADEVKRLGNISTKVKLRSLDILSNQNNAEIRLCVGTVDNALKLFTKNLKKRSEPAINLRSLTKLGHANDPRTVAFSSDSQLIASGSADSAFIWNQETLSCICSIETGYILTCCFVPGDRYLLLGYKTGELVIADIVTGQLVESINAHGDKELWSLCLTANMDGCVTGGGDATVKFWQFELVTDEQHNRKVLSVIHKNTLKLEEAVLCVRVSANGKFLACALLDCTVKLFFVDTLKFYLNLYGHKVPVNCMTISDDSALIATGSGDRNIKIWGMDFGDCHRSIFAHDDSVMGIQFIPKTHMLFSCGKDGQVKQWDADSFEKIATITRHMGSGLDVAVSPDGMLLVSCGNDRVLRLCEKTDEVIVLQDAQETEREAFENKKLSSGADSTVATAPGLKLASKKTVGSERGAESIMECLEICKQFDAIRDDGEKPERHPLMVAYNVDNTNDFLLTILKNIRASDLEESLLLIPFTAVCEIIPKVYSLAEERQDQTEMICKIVILLFRVHQKPISNNAVLYADIKLMIEKLKAILVGYRDLVGENLHALHMVRKKVEAKDGIDLFHDATKKKKGRDTHKKQKFNLKRRLVQSN